MSVLVSGDVCVPAPHTPMPEQPKALADDQTTHLADARATVSASRTLITPPASLLAAEGGDTTRQQSLAVSAAETLIEGMTVDASENHRQRFLSLQVDVQNDAQAEVPFPITQETFAVPSACPDDALVDGRMQLWVPGRPLRVAYITWNLANKPAFMPDIAAFCVRPNAHIIVVATQENGGYIGSSKGQMQWTDALAKECLRGQYTVVSQTVMWALHLVVFARSRDVAKYVAHVDKSSVKTATGGTSGNKGGVAIGFTVSMSPIASTAYELVSPPSTRRLGNPLVSDAHMSSHEARDGLHSEEGTQSSTTPGRAYQAALGSAIDQTGSTVQPVSAFQGDDGGGASPAAFFTPSPPSSVAPSHLSFLFVNAHLAAHQEAVANRNKGFARIVAALRVGTRGKHAKAYKRLLRNAAGRRILQRSLEQPHGPTVSATESESRPATARSARSASATGVTLYQLPRHASAPVPPQTKKKKKKDSSALKARDVTEGFDLTFFGGDLNYRLNGTKAALEKIIAEHKDIRSVLMYNDQLNIERQKGNVFVGYREGQLLFRPTYKYDVKTHSTTDTYNTGKKQRLPAYCDRVLFKKSHQSSSRQVTLRLYTDVRHVRTSDHKPVVALFDVETEEYAWV